MTPRIILGLWHPLFLAPAAEHLPTCRRYHIGISFPLARKFFWDACSGFSIAFPMLLSAEGQRFMEDCKREGKEVCAWTVNSREEMVWCARWGIKAIITDRVAFCVGVRREVSWICLLACVIAEIVLPSVGAGSYQARTPVVKEAHLPLVIMEVLLGSAGKYLALPSCVPSII